MDRPFKISLALVAASTSLLIISSNTALASNKYHDLKGARKVEKKEPAPQVKANKSEDETALEEHFKKLDEEGYDWRKHQSEFGIFGGDFLGDEWYNNWDVGGRYYFNFNKTFGIGAEYQYNPLRVDSSGDFGKSLTTKESHTVFGALTVANTAAFTSGRKIIDCDIYLTLGGGSMQINRQWQWMAMIGGGIKVYTPMRWMAVRFDVNSFMHPTPKPGGDAFNADMALNVGVSFFAQPNRDRPEKAQPASAPAQSD